MPPAVLAATSEKRDTCFCSVRSGKSLSRKYLLDEISQTSRRASAGISAGEHERLIAALKASRAGTWRWDVKTDVVEWDDALCDLYGIRREHAPRTAQEFFALVHPDDRAAASATIAACLENGADADYQFRAVVGGQVRWISDRSTLTRDAQGNPACMLGVCFDITERCRLEDERDRLLEKQTLLLRELTHRIKNHLSMIISLLRLKGARQKDPAAKQDFDRAIERVHTIAFLHEQLYRKDVFDRIDVASYVNDICDNLKASTLADSKISLACEVEPAELNIDQAVPLGLIINEVVTNAAKYAFSPDEEGRISIRFRRRGDRCLLSVSDNGRGVARPDQLQGIGSELVRALAHQIGARARVVSRNGFTHSFLFRASA